MKSRSHRLPDPSDDWGDGSWTVDCSCGVTFDDGDEMVSCDECGVWVHTRCARFVRGEVSFACHKCKASAARHEETEVAQLLAELPTKAPDPSALPPLPLRRPHVPMEQRVHVHGTPGGDPALFAGASPVFSPQLWKCAGYIPKKFNRQYHDYRDYPFREDAADCGGENPDSKGADVLFSLSKEIVPCSPARTMLASMISQEAVRKAEAEKAPDNVERSHGISKNERSMRRVLGANWGKRRKDESRERKKRPRDDLDRDSVDTKMRGTYSDESREPKKRPRDDPDRDSACTKTRESSLPEAKGEGIKEEGERAKIGDKPKHVFVIKASRGGSSNEVTKKRSSLATSVRVEKLKPLEGMVSEGEGSDAAKEPSVNETNTNKRRRKPDSDTPTVESENEEAGNKALRESEDKEPVDTHREDFPRGKRQVRKRRRLELKGQGVREAMKGQNRDLTSDDDPTTLSHSSNDVAEGNFSEDGAGDGVSSSSSDDTD